MLLENKHMVCVPCEVQDSAQQPYQQIYRTANLMAFSDRVYALLLFNIYVKNSSVMNKSVLLLKMKGRFI
jgi:hypothetical protein